MQSSKKQNALPTAKEDSSEAHPVRPIISETFSLTKRLNEMERKVNCFDDRLKQLEKKFKMGDKSVPSSNTENSNLQAEIVSLVKKMGETQDKNMKEWREAQEIGKAMIKEEVVRLLREFHVIDQNLSTSEGGNGDGDLHQVEVAETNNLTSESNEQRISTEISTTPISATMESDTNVKEVDATASCDEENCPSTSNAMGGVVSTADVTDASNNKNSEQPENQIEPCEKNAVEELGESVELVTLTDSEEDFECKSQQPTNSASIKNHAANNQLQTSPGDNSVPNFAHLPDWTIPNRLKNDEIDFHIKRGTKRVIIPSENKISKEKLEKILTGLKELLELDIGKISSNVVKAMTNLQLDSVVILHLNGIRLNDDNLKHILSKRTQLKPSIKRVLRLESLRVLTLAGRNRLTDESLRSVAALASNLKKLTLSSCEYTDKGIAELVKPRSGLSLNLVELSLERCQRLTNRSLIHLAECPNLQKLKLVKIPTITKTGKENFHYTRKEKKIPPCKVIQTK